MNTKSKKLGPRGGTQRSTTASKSLDARCREVSQRLCDEYLSSIPGLTFQKKLSFEQMGHSLGACQPDGGLFFYKKTLILALEGKYQNEHGNAIERWYKNHHILRNSKRFKPGILSYITICTGNGANEPTGKIVRGRIKGKVIYNTLADAHLNIHHVVEYNQYRAGDNSAYMCPDGVTTDFIYDIMKTALLERIEYVKTNL